MYSRVRDLMYSVTWMYSNNFLCHFLKMKTDTNVHYFSSVMLLLYRYIRVNIILNYNTLIISFLKGPIPSQKL